MSPLHILIAVDPRCVTGSLVSIRSVLDNMRPGTSVCFYIITNGIQDSDRQAIRRTAVQGEADVTVEFREFDPNPVKHLARSKRISHTAYAPFFLEQFLPATVTRCLYLDCDLVFERDVVELWETDLRGHPVGAVDNRMWQESEIHQQRLGLKEPRYFNSGVLLIDMKLWRERRIGARALAAAQQVGDRLILHDQDALNAALDGDWLALDEHWNLWVIDPSLEEHSRAVFHFMGTPKPWHADYRGRFGTKFFDYLDRTTLAGARPWNPLGVGYLLARVRNRFPYLPAIPRVVRAYLSERSDGGGRR